MKINFLFLTHSDPGAGESSFQDFPLKGGITQHKGVVCSHARAGVHREAYV